MDTSKEYILMCQKAEEIQNKFNEKNCDLFAAPDADELGEYNICGSEHHDFNRRKNIVSWEYEDGYVPVDGDKYNLKDIVFLPRQDQLQEMLTPKYTRENDLANYYLIWDFYDFCMNSDYYPCSLECLWLSFVMKTNYSKIWTGFEWEVSK